MTAPEYLKLISYDHAGNILIDLEEAMRLADAYESLSEEDKRIVHKELGEE